MFSRAFKSAPMLLFVALSACATAPSNNVTDTFSGAPAWVLGCDSAFAGEKNKFFCGVDGIHGAKNPMLARAGAESKARANLAAKVESQIKSGIDSYQMMVQGGAGDKSSDEQLVRQTSRELANMTLRDVKVRDTYVTKQGGIFVLVTLSFDSFRDTVGNANQLDEAMRKEIIARAEKSFASLDAATATQGGALPPLDK